MSETFAHALEARTQEVLDRCTRCGGCFEVCPMTAPAGIADANPVDIVRGVLDVIQGGKAAPEAERWAQVCSGSGSCIPRCKDGVNPRFMNFLELVGESMGISREDHFKRLKKMQDAGAILADVMDLVEEHNLKLEEVQDVIEKDLMGEQPLPLRRHGLAMDPGSSPG